MELFKTATGFEYLAVGALASILWKRGHEKYVKYEKYERR